MVAKHDYEFASAALFSAKYKKKLEQVQHESLKPIAAMFGPRLTRWWESALG